MTLGDHAREMRKAPTKPEKRLWRHLPNRQTGFNLRRQAVIASCIADFLCAAKALVIEIDGDMHCEDKDARREAFLDQQGYRTIRFTNADVMTNIEGVLDVIIPSVAALPDRWPHPKPSPEREGLTVSYPLTPTP